MASQMDRAIKYTLFFALISVICWVCGLFAAGLAFWPLFNMLVSVFIMAPMFGAGVAYDVCPIIWIDIYERLKGMCK